MNEELVSIITPTYNCGKYISEAIKSVINQTYKNWEMIIIDDCSTDNTKKVASKFTDKIFDFAWQDDFSKARNHAFDLATGEYLMWLDADDFVPTETANNIANWKNFDDDADVLLCPYITNFDKNLTPLFLFN